MRYTVVGINKLTDNDQAKLITLSRALSDKGFFLVTHNYRPLLPLRIFHNSTLPNKRISRSYRNGNVLKERLLEVMEGEFPVHQAYGMLDFFCSIYDPDHGSIIELVLCYTRDGKRTARTTLQEMICQKLDIPFLWIGKQEIYNNLINL